MKKIIYFFIVGLVFTALQVATVWAQGTGGDHHGERDHCQSLHPSGTTHTDPDEAVAGGWEAEWLDNSGSLSEATYTEVEAQGHSRDEVNCYLQGARREGGDHRGDHRGDRRGDRRGDHRGDREGR